MLLRWTIAAVAMAALAGTSLGQTSVCPSCGRVCNTGPAYLAWSYYGLGDGGPTITYPNGSLRFPRANETVSPRFHKPSTPVWAPLPEVDEPVAKRQMSAPRHPGIGYGWLGYFSPSPRPKPPTANVMPAPRESFDSNNASANTSASMTVNLTLPHPDAVVQFNQMSIPGNGVRRSFESPALSGEGSFAYEIKVSWIENGVQQTQTRSVIGKAGETVQADFRSLSPEK